MKNTVKCPCCDFDNALVKSSGKGGLSVHCPECGYQGFARTPKAAGALGKKLTVEPTPEPAKKSGGFLDAL